MALANRTAEAVSAVRALGERVRPLALARERMLPVDVALAPLFPDGGLHRGMVVGCEGVGSTSLALALAAAATQAGAWAGVVGLPDLSVPAAVELGVAVERLFRVTTPGAEHLVTVLAAVADGAEVVIARGTEVRAGEARRLSARLTARGSVLVLVGPTGGFSPDVVCRVVTTQWEGLESGAGRLAARRVTVEATGRRIDRRRRVEVWCPGRDGSVAPTVAIATAPANLTTAAAATAADLATAAAIADLASHPIPRAG